MIRYLDKVKPGVYSYTPQMTYAKHTVDGTRPYREYIVTVTSECDGKHGKNSLHEYGLAFDVRTRDLPEEVVQEWVFRIATMLGYGFDVIWEQGNGQHIHIEYDIRKIRQNLGEHIMPWIKVKEKV
jgi:hypothetical protein